MAEKTKGCETCVFFVRQDEGYSNWTVESTTGYCLHRHNPGLPCDLDMFDGKQLNAILGFGETCSLRREGEPYWFDVDYGYESGDYKDDPNFALLEAWAKNY